MFHCVVRADNKYFNNTFNLSALTSECLSLSYAVLPADLSLADGTMHKAGPNEYLTNIIGNASLAWLDGALNSSQPFLAYIAPHGEGEVYLYKLQGLSDPAIPGPSLALTIAHTPAAPHVPATAAHEYENAPLPGGVETAPRLPNWDYGTAHHHWLVSDKEPLSPALVQFSDQLFARRLRATMSVDDIVAAVLGLLQARGALDDTCVGAGALAGVLPLQLYSRRPPAPLCSYVLFTSDHGYDLGQFRLPSGELALLPLPPPVARMHCPPSPPPAPQASSTRTRTTSACRSSCAARACLPARPATTSWSTTSTSARRCWT